MKESVNTKSSKTQEKRGQSWFAVFSLRKPHTLAKPSPEEEQEALEEAKRSLIEPAGENPTGPLDKVSEEPLVGTVAPVTETIPFEQERRSYERRKPSPVPWLGEERRKRDRRKEPTFPMSIADAAKESAPVGRWSRARLLPIFLGLVVLSVFLGGVAYYFAN